MTESERQIISVPRAIQIAVERHRAGQLAETEQICRQILQIEPDNPEALHLLGVIAQEAGKLDVAVEMMANAAVRQPSNPDLLRHLGSAYRGLKKFAEAENCFRAAMALAADSAETCLELGDVLYELGRLEDAERSIRDALTVEPSLGAAHRSLGNVLKELGRPEEAERSYRRALELQPEDVAAYNNCGTVLAALGFLEEAERCYNQALALKPDHAMAHCNLGNVRHALGQVEEAVRSYRSAIAHNPALAPAHSNLLYALNYLIERSPGNIYAEHREFGNRFCQVTDCRLRGNSHDADRKLRIGYVSGDFRDHSISFFIEPVLAKHDRSQFEIFCYYNFSRPDAVTQRLRSYVDHWREVHALGDEAMANLIREDAIDILVDLSGHTANNRLPVFGRKPAPVQAGWLGYLNTTGLEAMDYRITDIHASPEGLLDAYHSEQLIRLPDSQWCYQPPNDCPEVALPPFSRFGHVTFAAFAVAAKISPTIIELWSRLLERVPGSRLLVVTNGLHSVSTDYATRFTRHGIPSKRLQLLGSKPFHEYLALHHSADVVLDTFPFAGGTTTCHALWMGVPVVTLAGNTATSRGGVSLLHAVGLGELVARNADQYLEIAASLADDPKRLAALRAGMRGSMRSSPLMDTERFTRHLEAAYRSMWRIWCDCKAQSVRPTDERQVTMDLATTEVLRTGLEHLEAGRLDQAEEAFRRALLLRPDSAEAHNNLGNALQRLGRLEDAGHSYRQAVALNPDFAEAHNNLGTVFVGLGRLDDAERCYLRALALKPCYANAYNNLSVIQTHTGRLNEAEGSLRKAQELKPDSAEIHNNLGVTLAGLGRLDEAEQCLRQSLALMPGYADAHNNLGNALRNLGRTVEAEQSYRHALALTPDVPGIHCNRLYTLNCIPGWNASEIYAEHREFERRFCQVTDYRPHGNSRDPDRRLRIGYVSGDFRDHSVSFFIEPVLERHIRSQFEIFCYYNFSRSDAVTQRLRSYADHWREVHALGDEAMANLIREDAIDILVDLSGHTANNRLPVFGRKPAPVQVTYLGYPATTGLTAMDYRLTDAVVDPEGEGDRWYSERLVRLPGTMWCYRPHEALPEVTPAPALTKGYVTFGSLNHCAKLNPQVFELWARLLERLPGSRLIVTSIPAGNAQARLRECFPGIGAERLEIYDRVPRDQFNALVQQFDIALDPFPYGGTTTTCDAMWKGIPVITLSGGTTASRSGASLLNAVGFDCLVARTGDSYLEIATGLARDLPRLAEMRFTLRARMRSSPLVDAERFTRNLEQSYRTICRSWCSSRA